MAKIKNLIIDQGSDYTIRIKTNPVIDLTGFTLTSSLRKHHDSPDVYTISVVVDDIDSEYFNLSLSSLDSYNIPYGIYFYDVYGDNGVNVIRLIEGTLTITPSVTKPTVEEP